MDELLALLPLFNLVVVAHWHVVLDLDAFTVLLVDDANVAQTRMLERLGLIVGGWLAVAHLS